MEESGSTCPACSIEVMFGKWTNHVRSWRLTDLGDRILYVTYEDMIEVRHLLHIWYYVFICMYY